LVTHKVEATGTALENVNVNGYCPVVYAAYGKLKLV
jgi:hypothetical protein